MGWHVDYILVVGLLTSCRIKTDRLEAICLQCMNRKTLSVSCIFFLYYSTKLRDILSMEQFDFFSWSGHRHKILRTIRKSIDVVRSVDERYGEDENDVDESVVSYVGPKEET